MTRTLPILCLLAATGLAAPARSDDAAVKAALGRELVGPKKAMADVQDFVEVRIPRMPEVRTADEWRREAERLRSQTYENVLFRGEAAKWRDASTRVEWQETIDGGPGYRIKKLRFEVLPGLWIPALLYEPAELRGKAPVVLNVNGHDSKGKAAEYKQMRCINQAKRGMLAMNLEWFGMGQLATPGFQHGLINAIDLCGSSGIATHYLAMKRAIDILLAHEHADPARVGVTGLSGGGWQTIFISGLDPRVTFCDPVAGYSSFFTRVRYLSDLGDSEQTPCDLGTVVDYTHLTAMRAPHPTLLTFNAKDNCCFAAPHALPPLVEACAPIYQLFGVPGNLRAHVNVDPGDHNYLLDNRQALYQALADFWGEPGQVWSPKEVPSEGELKTAEQLKVALPDDNLDFRKLSLALAKDLPRGGDASEGRRKELRSVVKPLTGSVDVERVDQATAGGTTVSHFRLRVASAFTVPAVRFEPETPKGPLKSVLVIADEGKKSTADVVGAQLEAGRRAVALDPYYFGESKPAERDYLWSLMIATVGQRPLGVQVGEVLAAARAFRPGDDPAPVSIVAVGPRTSVVALVAAALEPELIGDVELHEPMASLKELLEEGQPYTHAPELFCFGLLPVADVKDLAALVAPRKVTLVKASERAREALGGSR